MANSIDPKNELLHRVTLETLINYKAQMTPAVIAICGKVWAPTYPVNRERLIPRCPTCFPENESTRYGIAR